MAFLRRLLKNPYSLVIIALVVAGLAILLSSSHTVWAFTTDDSYITYRYSANLASGFGPTFNRIPPRAEGYTSFLWMLVMTIPHLFGIGPLTFAKVLGLLFTVGTVAWLFAFHGLRGSAAAPGFSAAAVTAFFFCFLPETAIHAVSGMETTMYTFFITGLAVLAYYGTQNCPWALNWLPVMALFAGLTRPEGNLTAILLLGGVALALPKCRRFLLLVLVLYILPGLAYFLWRWSYFGVALPLPFYVKSGGLSLVGWLPVRDFLIFLLSNFGLYIGLGVLRERPAVRVLLLTALPNLLFFLFNHHIMGYDYRFLYPMLPTILNLAGLGLAFLIEKAAAIPVKAKPWLLPIWLVVLVVFMFGSQTVTRMQRVFDHKIDYAQGMIRNHLAIGHALHAVAHNEESPVLVVNDAGAMPYFSGWHTIDAGGLNDRYIAIGRVDPIVYIYSCKPDVVVLMSTDLVTFKNDSQYAWELYNNALASGLQVVARSNFYQQDTIWVLARPGSDAAKSLRASFSQ